MSDCRPSSVGGQASVRTRSTSLRSITAMRILAPAADRGQDHRSVAGNAPAIAGHDRRCACAPVIRLFGRKTYCPLVAIGWRDERLRQRAGDEIPPEVHDEQPLLFIPLARKSQ